MGYGERDYQQNWEGSTDTKGARIFFGVRKASRHFYSAVIRGLGWGSPHEEVDTRVKG